MSNYNLALYYPEIVNDDYVKQNVISSSNNIGTTSGRGSSSRIFNNCIDTANETYQQCLSEFLWGPVDPPLGVDNVLFDTTFKDTIFERDSKFIGIGAKFVPQYIKDVILSAASRWKELLTLTPEYINYVRNYQDFPKDRFKRWNGISFSLINEVTTDEKVFASCNPSNYIPNDTSIFTSVRLKIWKKNFQQYPTKQLDILTHELGHGLGFTQDLISKPDGTGTTELLPNIVKNKFLNLVNTNPDLLGQAKKNPGDPDPIYYWKNTVGAYNKYEGYKPPTLLGSPMPQNNVNIPIQKGDAHWFPFTLEGIENPSTVPILLTTNYLYRGFYNEIMISGIDEKSPNLVISDVTLQYLGELYSEIGGKIIKNYNLTGKTEVTNAYLSQKLATPKKEGVDIIVFNIDDSKSLSMENEDTVKNFINFCPTCENTCDTTCNHNEYIYEKQVRSFIPQKKVISMYNFILNK